MRFPSNNQNIQDWITQQWVILFGKRINSVDYKWLLGPFGQTNGIGAKIVPLLEKKENLEIDKNRQFTGLLTSINDIELSPTDRRRLAKNVIDFYENTIHYDLDLTVKWNPVFKIFGTLLRLLFSKRIEQLNIPLKNYKQPKEMNSSIIHLVEQNSKKLKRIIWLRTFKQTNQVVYSGIYELCKLPKGSICLKAIFPLPNGNATVILQPTVGTNGELILTSSGRKIGDSGFYFLLKDSKGSIWTKYIKSFKDSLIVSTENEKTKAKQVLKFYGIIVVSFEYQLTKNNN